MSRRQRTWKHRPGAVTGPEPDPATKEIPRQPVFSPRLRDALNVIGEEHCARMLASGEDSVGAYRSNYLDVYVVGGEELRKLVKEAIDKAGEQMLASGHTLLTDDAHD